MSALIERFVSCVVLCRSEALETYVEELSALLSETFSDYEIVLVNDRGNPALEAAIAGVLQTQPYVRALRLTQHNGDHVAASAGIEAAIGDYVCVLDSDNDPPPVAADAVELSITGADVVMGIDRSRGTRHGLGWALERLFMWYTQRFLHIDTMRGSGSFRCMSRYAVNALLRLPQPHRYYRIWGAYVGLSTKRMVYDGRRRREGRRLLASIDEALDIIVGSSPHPLRMISALAGIFAMGNLAYILYIVGIFVLKDEVVSGWTTLSLQVAVLSLFMIMLFAGISEYIGRILERVAPTPAYWVRDEQTSRRFAGDKRRNVVERSNPPTPANDVSEELRSIVEQALPSEPAKGVSGARR